MRLRTDFNDFYDSCFSYRYTCPVFERIGGNTGPGRREQHRLLEDAGFKVPPHGLVQDVYYSWWEDEKKWVRAMVAYEDETAHCGEGKVIVSDRQLRVSPTMGYTSKAEHERDRLSKLYCVAFVGHHQQQWSGVSWRRLQVGRDVFWIEYSSKTSWMSNVDPECKVIGRELNAGFHPVIKRPLFAIDFVLGKEMYAVDLNFSPGMRGSGMEDEISPEQVVGAITEWFETFGEVAK